MTETKYPQLRIVPTRFLNPETTEILLDKIYTVDGIRRLVLNGPNLPATVPYGPARGEVNDNTHRRIIKVCGEDYLLHVQVGSILLELDDASVIPLIKAACDEVFSDKFPYGITEGTYMRSNMTTTDYAKYGIVDDKRILGMSDPKSKQRPIILQGIK
ncbi:MAG: methyl-coenzyme M reductase operon protein D [Methanocorpusculum sp.]|uniref:methyl-coenzyme M reductase operon protein D n=1 Tax=Methanocorpusculum sp. TaxID=2058474 RepID=UPI002B1E9B77|nr:methyl-coenzyme M reductase operon protein D [Methanocorpusculum sp.]MEA5087168.1 methyl-coenzyme M reductase operon protein D [Methanocorpusculum sp.]